MQIGGTSMLLVYPKFYFLPIIKEVKFEETDAFREDNVVETMIASKTLLSKEDGYKKLLEEIDEEFVSEELLQKKA